ncbi:MAG TPA: hypothetical protein VJ875_16985 [Pyrinomonadaceae bacterium]|nr:hypothetical protein [Pyrinomonadaceae bacterium]
MCKSASELVANAFGEMAGFVSHLQKHLLDGQQFRTWRAPETWFASGSDALAAIRVLAANEELECVIAEPPDASSFLYDLQASARDPQRRFDLLTARYLHPLNIAAPSEDSIREHILERLMVADRSRIEQHSLRLLNAGDLLLRLNLIAINASLTDDLRYLDALNYYYELLPSAWYPDSPRSWLRVSFLTFYVRALMVHSAHIS